MISSSLTFCQKDNPPKGVLCLTLSLWGFPHFNSFSEVCSPLRGVSDKICLRSHSAGTSISHTLLFIVLEIPHVLSMGFVTQSNYHECLELIINIFTHKF